MKRQYKPVCVIQDVNHSLTMHAHSSPYCVCTLDQCADYAPLSFFFFCCSQPEWEQFVAFELWKVSGCININLRSFIYKSQKLKYNMN